LACCLPVEFSIFQMNISVSPSRLARGIDEGYDLIRTTLLLITHPAMYYQFMLNGSFFTIAWHVLWLRV